MRAETWQGQESCRGVSSTPCICSFSPCDHIVLEGDNQKQFGSNIFTYLLPRNRHEPASEWVRNSRRGPATGGCWDSRFPVLSPQEEDS